MQNRRFTTIFVAIAALLLTQSGCKQQDRFQDLKDYVQQVQQQVKNKLKHKSAEEVVEPKSIVYHANALREPFGDKEQDGSGKMVDANPLLDYPLNMLRLVGTVSHGRERIAYIMAPSNMIYHVGIGDLIGDHQGKVISIMPDRVSVMELYSEEGAAMTKRIIVLKLQGET